MKVLFECFFFDFFIGRVLFQHESNRRGGGGGGGRILIYFPFATLLVFFSQGILMQMADSVCSFTTFLKEKSEYSGFRHAFVISWFIKFSG